MVCVHKYQLQYRRLSLDTDKSIVVLPGHSAASFTVKELGFHNKTVRHVISYA